MVPSRTNNFALYPPSFSHFSIDKIFIYFWRYNEINGNKLKSFFIHKIWKIKLPRIFIFSEKISLIFWILLTVWRYLLKVDCSYNLWFLNQFNNDKRLCLYNDNFFEDIKYIKPWEIIKNFRTFFMIWGIWGPIQIYKVKHVSYIVYNW